MRGFTQQRVKVPWMVFPLNSKFPLPNPFNESELLFLGSSPTSLTCRSPMELRGVVLAESLRAAAARRARWFATLVPARFTMMTAE